MAVGYGASLFVLVLTKENAAFVFLALVGRADRFRRLQIRPRKSGAHSNDRSCAGAGSRCSGWIRWWNPRVDRVLQPVCSEIAASALSDSFSRWCLVSVSCRFYIAFALHCRFGNRAHFSTGKEIAARNFLVAFPWVSFISMSSVPYGMSLRFAAYWDFPLRWLAASQVLQLARKFPRIGPVILGTVVILILGRSGPLSILAIFRARRDL